MRAQTLILHVGSLLILCSFLHQVHSTLMLGSMMLAAKTGLMLGKMGVGGMMMMLLAASQQNYDGSNKGYGRKRSVRSAEDSTKSSKLATQEEILLTERMVRQIDSTFDSLTCIPKFVCGMNAQPPSKKTSIINDYGHLLKLMLDDSDDDDEDSEEGSASSKGKKGLRLKDTEKMEDAVNDELIEEDPALLPFILKDIVKRKDVPHDDDEYFREPPPLKHFYPRPPPPRTPLSSLTSFFPKIQAGLGTKIADTDFDSDPFFSGFRSLKAFLQNETKGEHKPVPILDLEEESDGPVKMTSLERTTFIRRKSKELEMSKDALKKYRIAAEVGRKLKNKQDCAKVFKKCPYNWEEVTGVVSNLRNVITNHPAVTGKQPAQESKVVYLKTSSGSGANQSMLSIASAAAEQGTTVIHDLGNGTLMEISMKLVPLQQVDILPAPAVDNLGMSAEDLKRPNSTPVYALDTQFPNREPPKLTEDIGDTVVNLQIKNFNKTSVKPSKKQRPRPSGGLPALKEFDIPAPEKPVGEDDEFDDAYPIHLSPQKTKKKVPVVVKTKKPPPPDKDDEGEAEAEEDEDEDDNDDDGEDEDEENDEEEYYQERKFPKPSASVTRKKTFMSSRIPPFPLQRRAGNTFVMPKMEDPDVSEEPVSKETRSYTN